MLAANKAAMVLVRTKGRRKAPEWRSFMALEGLVSQERVLPKDNSASRFLSVTITRISGETAPRVVFARHLFPGCLGFQTIRHHWQ
jgi:hypothetical protein